MGGYTNVGAILPSQSLLQSIANPQAPPNAQEMQLRHQALLNAQQQGQAGALDIQQKQQTIQQQQQVVQAFKDSGGDMDKAIAQLQGQGNPQAMTLMTHRAEFQKVLEEHRKMVIDNATHQADLVGRSAQSVLDAPDPAKGIIYAGQKHYLEQNGLVQPGQLPDVYSPDLEPNLKSLVANSQSVKDAAETAKNKQQTTEAAAKQTQTEQETKFNAALQPGKEQIQGQTLTEAKWKMTQPLLQNAIKNGTYADAYAKLSPDLKQLAPDPKTNPTLRDMLTPEQQVTATAKDEELRQGAQRVILARDRVQLDRELQSGDELSPDAQSTAARMYLQTGQMPQLGMGKAATKNRDSIMNLAATMQPGADLASNKAGFAADQGSLKKLQATRDSTVAFENTAGKNLDQFISTMKGAIDTGSPLLNKPLREISGTAFGSTNQAALNAAQQVATTEIAKVLNNPGGNTALSDSARKEASELLPQNATLEQTYRVAKLLRQDMANRRQSYDEQIAEIKGRIGGKPATAAPSTNQQSFKAGDSVMYQGKAHKVTAVDPATGKLTLAP